MAKTLDEAGVKRLIQEIKGANKNLNAPIPISTENTPESMAQNVKNIADYVAKAKAAGIANVNGMAVTCSIYDDYSGVGYLYSYADSFSVQGVLVKDDLVDNMCFSVSYSGRYSEKGLIVSGNEYAEVSSSMLAEGARKPIILTPSTTEVDEATYQKLLSDDVDVVFKTDDGDANLCILTFKYDDGDAWSFTFTCFSREGESLSETFFYGYEVRITKIGNPHPCEVIDNSIESQFSQILRNEGFTNRSFLSPVLQEIDLTGTDADRKAKLDQFEADWKALTGASDLTGARFVGQITTPKGGYASVLFTYNIGIDTFTGVTNLDDSDYRNHYSVYLNGQGVLTITPLFSHLEAITIYTDNTPEHMQANLDNIAAYEANLQALGVDTTKGWNAPASFSNGDSGILSYLVGDYYLGIQFINNNYTTPYSFAIRKSDGLLKRTYIITESTSISSLTTTSKLIIPAINEVNALAKGYSTIFTPIELTTETAQNKTAIDARVAAFTAQGISLTNGCCIPVTYKGVYAGNISLINGDWYGLLVKNTNNPADNINIKLSADGTITEGNSAQ